MRLVFDLKRAIKFDHFVLDLVTLLNLEFVSAVQSLKLFDIIGLLGVLNIKSLHEEIRRVATLRNVELNRSKVVEGLSSLTLETSVAVSHQDNSIEVEEGF